MMMMMKKESKSLASDACEVIYLTQIFFGFAFVSIFHFVTGKKNVKHKLNIAISPPTPLSPQHSRERNNLKLASCCRRLRAPFSDFWKLFTLLCVHGRRDTHCCCVGMFMLLFRLLWPPSTSETMVESKSSSISWCDGNLCKAVRHKQRHWHKKKQ